MSDEPNAPAATSPPAAALGAVDHDQLVKITDSLFDKVLERLDRSDAPIWEHQAAVGRTLITLSGGGIIASVSVLQFIADRLIDPQWAWLLPATWIAWVTSLLLGVARESWMSVARSAAARLERARGNLRARIRELAPHHTVQDLESLWLESFASAEREPATAVTVVDWLTRISFWAFAGGVGALVAFAIRNLPF